MDQRNFAKKATEAVTQFSQEVEKYDWENESFYKLWLAQTNAFVQYSSGFLKMCYEGLAATHPLKERFHEHIAEEAGHEKMSQNDMKFMKAHSESVFPVTQVFWKNQFYWIKEVSPTSHLGYIILLEGLAALAGPKILTRVRTAGHKGVTFLKVHAEEDQDHFAEAIHSTEPISDSDREAVYENLMESLYLYEQILGHCAARTMALKKRPA